MFRSAWFSASQRIWQYVRYPSSPIWMPMRSHSAPSQASSTCTWKPAAAIASYSTRMASAMA
jgi:hypothetical protein